MTKRPLPAKAERHLIRLRVATIRLAEMWSDPLVQCYDDRDLPTKEELKCGSVFLAGPTSRSGLLELNHRSTTVAALRGAGYKGWIFVPEHRGVDEKQTRRDFTFGPYCHEWESKRLLLKCAPEGRHKKSFWIPRNSGELLGLNTNLEDGIILGLVMAGKIKRDDVIIGWPKTAERMGLPMHYTGMAGCVVYDTHSKFCAAIADT